MTRKIARTWRIALGVLAIGALLDGVPTGGGAAHAQDYPSRSVRVIVPFVAGGSSDVGARILSAKLSEGLGQQFVVDNRAGAGGTLGADLAAKSAPDGHTVLYYHVGMTYGPALYKSLPYDVVADFAPVSLVGQTPSLLIVHPKFPVNTTAEFQAYAKANPRKINYGSAGVGSSGHLGAALFESLTQIKLTMVPYKGAGAAVAAMITGEVDCMIETIGSLTGGIKGGQLRPIAISSERRSPLFPELPTVIESGVPGYTYTTWFAVWAPAKTPRDIIAKLNKAIVTAMEREDTKTQFANAGIETETSTPEQLDARVKSELARWGKIIPEAGIEPQ